MSGMPDEIGSLLRAAGPLPKGLPPGARASLARLGEAGSPSRPRAWLPAALGLAAGILLAVGGWGVLAPEPPIFRERMGGAPGWRRLALADGSEVELAPGASLRVLGKRPGRVAALDGGTAFFSVPSGPGAFSVEVPGGRVEVVGTSFGITVNPDTSKGEGEMTRNPWMIGAAGAVLAVGVTSGVVHYVGEADGATPVKAGEQLEVGRAGRTRVTNLNEREVALAAREKVVGERLVALEARETELKAREEAARLAALSAPVPSPADPEAEEEEEGMMGTLSDMMDNPEMMREMMRPEMEKMYGDFFPELALDEEAEAAIQEVLLDRALAGSDIWKLLMDPEISDEEILRRQEEGFSAAAVGLVKHLRPDQLARLEAYEAGIPQRMLANQADEKLKSLRLPEDLHRQVRQVFVEELQGVGDPLEWGAAHSRRWTAEDVRKARAMTGLTGSGAPDPVAFQEKMKQMSERNERIYARVQPMLTPKQFEAFKKKQVAELKMMEMGMKMMMEVQP